MKTKNGCHIGWVYSYKCVDPSMEQYFGRIVYVGQSRRKGGINVRDSRHKNDTETRFDRTYKKHPDSFQLIGEEEFLATSEKELIGLLNEYESKLISRYDCIVDHGHGLNLTMGGGVKGVSEETRHKISEALKKHYEDPEERRKRSELSTKMWENPERKKRQSEAIKKLHKDPEYISKLSYAQKKRYSDPAEHRRRSELSTKMWQNEEHRKKCIDAQKKRYEDQKEREKQSERLKGKNVKPCQIFDIETGFYFDFESRGKASEFVGISKTMLYLYTSKPYKGRYLFIPD